MATNIDAFDLRLKLYREETVPEVIRGRVTGVALEGGRGLAEYTPVDRGHAKGNWQFTVGEPAEGEIERLDKSAEGTSATSNLFHDALNGMRAWEMGQTIWYHNGVPYIRYLNDGTEKMAAFAMVPRTVARLQRSFGREAA